MKLADKSYFTDASKKNLVDEGTPEAAFLVVGKGSAVTPEMEKQYGIKGVEQEEVKQEPGIVTSAGPDGGQGFVSAAEAKDAGIVVSGEAAVVEDETDKEEKAAKTKKK